MPNNAKANKPVDVQPLPSVPEDGPVVSEEVIEGPHWEVVAVQFSTEIDIPNRGKLTKIAKGMSGIEIEESQFPDRPGVFIFTNPETMVYVPYSLCSVRYRLVK